MVEHVVFSSLIIIYRGLYMVSGVWGSEIIGKEKNPADKIFSNGDRTDPA
jgi:hypothetical protein